jgi:group I intron endonuclease
VWIYNLVNVESGKVYIGQTVKTPKTRFREHINQLSKNKHHNKYLQRDWNLYGENAFKFTVIRECSSLNELDEVEKTLIAESGKNAVYNISSGGQVSRKNGMD